MKLYWGGVFFTKNNREIQKKCIFAKEIHYTQTSVPFQSVLLRPTIHFLIKFTIKKKQ
jgi:hypothetical protein